MNWHECKFTGKSLLHVGPECFTYRIEQHPVSPPVFVLYGNGVVLGASTDRDELKKVVTEKLRYKLEATLQFAKEIEKFLDKEP
jgi:hypothetical protein